MQGLSGTGLRVGCRSVTGEQGKEEGLGPGQDMEALSPHCYDQEFLWDRLLQLWRGAAPEPGLSGLKRGAPLGPECPGGGGGTAPKLGTQAAVMFGLGGEEPGSGSSSSGHLSGC